MWRQIPTETTTETTKSSGKLTVSILPTSRTSLQIHIHADEVKSAAHSESTKVA